MSDGQKAAGQLLMLSASEVAEYTYCPQAWYLRRHQTPRNAEAALRLEAGNVAHRHIGRQSDALLYMRSVRTLLLIVIVIVTFALTIEFVTARIAPLA
jgi:CRISPR/Cas system-associated exonuclease Cas4 (RecB family)